VKGLEFKHYQLKLLIMGSSHKTLVDFNC
jgi:hypothetical protein